MSAAQPTRERPPSPGRRLGPTSAPRPILIAFCLLGAAMLATALLTSTEWWVGVFEHEVRTQRRGGVVAATTVEGARWWRMALVLCGVLLPTLMGAIWLLCRGPRSAAQPVATRRGERTTASEPAPRSSMGLGRLLLPLLVLVGLAVRLPRLTESLWYDEIADFLAFGQFGPGPTMGNYFTLSNHVLNGILCWLAVQIAGGANEVVLRTPALLASLGSIPALWWLGREAACDARDARTARGGSQPSDLRFLPWCMAGFAALAPVMVLEAVEARGYALMILASALASGLFLRGTRESESPESRFASWALYVPIIALGTWAHLVTACVAAGHALVLLFELRDRGRWRRVAAGLIAILAGGVLFTTLFSPALPDLLAIRSEFRSLDGDEPTLFGPEGLHALLQIGGAWSLWAALPGLVLACEGVVSTRRSRPLARALLATVAGAAVAVALATLGGSWLYARFMLFTLPAAALMVGLGMCRVLASGRSRAVFASVAAILVGAWLGDLWRRPPKQPLREAVLEVAQSRRPGEQVATIGLPDNVLDWYAWPLDLRIEPTGLHGSRLGEVLDRDQPRWIVVLYEPSVAGERLEELRRRGYVVHRRLPGWVDWGAGEVVIWRRDTRG